MNIHISTASTFQFDDMPPTDCPFCKRETLYSGWVGFDCSTCGALGERYVDALMHVRRKLRLTRKQLGAKMGYSGKTIKKYEWCGPSEKYFERFKSFVAAHYRVNKED